MVWAGLAIGARNRSAAIRGGLIGGALVLAAVLATINTGMGAPADSTMQSASAATTASPVTTAPTAADSTAQGYAVPTLPIPDLGYNAREGRALFHHYCMNCHGEEGKGDGFNAYNLDPRPRALADSTFQATHSDDDLAAAIRAGGGSVGLSTAMPPWGRTLNERKIRNIVDYLRALAKREARSGETPAR
jgi:mono/diheme cytochrome c family protein